MILLTAFTPFQGVAVNPSQLILERIIQPDVFTHLLPTEYDKSSAILTRLIDELKPQAVICLGVAQTREAINLERIALNVDDASKPDNAGSLRQGLPIIADAPLAYASTLPLEAMQTAIKAHGIPAVISNHAGAFVCNHVFYTARHALETSGAKVPCGFIHVPAILEADGKGLPLEQMVEAVEVCLEVVRETVGITASH